MIGFSSMLVIDEVSKIFKEWSLKPRDPEGYSPIVQKSKREEEGTDLHPAKNVMVTTIGLCFHSVAEGVAMGASLYRKYFIILFQP